MRLKPSAPRDGDVVVTRESGSRVHYTVRQLPGTPQVSASVREDAEQLARNFAQRHAVDVWYSETAAAYRLVEACRPRTLVRAPEPGERVLVTE